jgi:hypothetical protein
VHDDPEPARSNPRELAAYQREIGRSSHQRDALARSGGFSASPYEETHVLAILDGHRAAEGIHRGRANPVHGTKDPLRDGTLCERDGPSDASRPGA